MFGGVWSAFAELPSLQGDNRWLGYFVGVENRDSQLTIAAKTGQIALRAMGRNGKPAAQKVFVAFDCQILETLPNGDVKACKLIPESLSSDQEATLGPKNLIIRGKVKGDASFELSLNEDRGKFLIGGRVVDAGSITNPLRFAIQVRVQNAYPYEKTGSDKKQLEAFEKKIKGDKMQLTLADGKRLRPSTSDPTAAVEDGLQDAMVTEAQVEFSSWLDKRLQITAMGGSTLRMEVIAGKPLWEGFSWVWSADSKKDPQSKATLQIEMK